MSPRPKPPEERFFSHVEVTEDGHWLWTGYILRNGYARFWTGDRRALAHRWSYEHFVGPIPEGLQIDHLCRVRHCVNPAHLEPVTCRENILRGTSPLALAAASSHCHAGHLFDDENTREASA